MLIMAETASDTITIEASPDAVWAIATDLERYPEWARDVKDVVITARDENGRPSQVEFRTSALGRSTHYTLRYDYSEAPEAFSWKFVEGDMLRRLDGSYTFESEGPALTRVQYDLSVELAMPLPGLVKRRAAGLIMGSALKELKKQVEAVA